jgi:glycosyltransferase involved in cell wall biosynthesis
MHSTPIVSVVLPVFNCEKYIFESVTSVLNQTFTDFELLIIDDCSTDATLSIIKSISDARIILLEKPKNTGYTDSLNYGISIAKGKFIARMDADDVCLPNRFAKQVAFLNENPEVILCGTAIQMIGSDKKLHHPVTHEEILVKLCFGTSFCHPSIMARKEVLWENNYDKSFEPAEDYELWTRLAFLGKLANLDAVLLQYREHPQQISNTNTSVQLNNAFRAKLQLLNRLAVLDFFTEKEVFTALENGFNYTFSDCKKSMQLFDYLRSSNKKLSIFQVPIFEEKVFKLRIAFLKRFLEKGETNTLQKLLFLSTRISLVDFFKVLNLSKKLSRKTPIKY